MSEKAYLLILRVGIYASLLSVFLVFKDLLFPFISSKQISFNVLIEILTVFWIAFIVKFPSYRPSWSYISFGLIAFFAAMMLSSIFGVDFALSFWGDVERMLGLFHLLHFLAFYFIAITVMRRWIDWQIFLIISTVFALIISIMGIGQDTEPYATIGNVSYVAGYLIFNLYFCLLLFFKEKAWGIRWLYLIPIPFYIIEFLKTDTTGATVGLGFSIMVMFFLYGVLAKDKRIKFATLGLSLLLVLSTAWVLNNKDSEFVRTNSFLAPLAGIDFNKATFQTRLISWKAAWKDFKDHPFLGTGHGNYAIVFDKYFDAKFYSYTSSETYFDRAHNNVIDIASTSGSIGLLAYLSIFAAVAYYLVLGYRRGYFGIHEFVLISALLIAYFVQNLAVFDSLVTYMGLMMTLAFIYWHFRQGEEGDADSVKEKGKAVLRQAMGAEELRTREIYTLLGVGGIMLVIIWQFNLLPYQMLVETIGGQKAWAQGDPKGTVEIYKKALARDTVLDRDSRTSLIRLFSSPDTFNAFPENERLKVADYLIEQAEANVAFNKEDSLSQLMLAQLLDTVSRLVAKDPQRFLFYSDRALAAIDASIKASPQRPPVYYQKAQIHLTRGETDQAVEALKTAYQMNQQFTDSACHLGKTMLYLKKDEAEAYSYIDKCVDMGGAQLLAPVGQIKNFLARYEKNKDEARVIKVREGLMAADPNDMKNMIDLAKIYAKNGQIEKAISLAAKIADKDPSLKSYVTDFIEGLNK